MQFFAKPALIGLVPSSTPGAFSVEVSGKIADFRHAELHACSQFVAGDTCSKFGVTGEFF